MIKNMTNIRAYFALTGFDVPPDNITKMLGMNPDDSAQKGELRERQASGGSYQVMESFWKLYSSVSDSYNIEDYIEDLVEKLSPISSNLSSICGQIGDAVECNIIVVIRVIPDSSLPGLLLKPKIMSFLCESKISLVVDMN